MSARISIIIVSYNCESYLRVCLQKLQVYLQPARDEVIVVDNASSDSTIAMLKSEFDWVKLIEAGENLGFGRANNLGMQQAQGDYFFLLNPDTELLGDAMGAGLQFYESEHAAGVGVVGFPLLSPNLNPEVSAGNFPNLMELSLDLLPAKLFPYRLKERKKAHYTIVDYVSGADLFLPRSTYEAVGGFDPVFFLFYEETEWQYRMQKNGLLRVILAHPAIIHHVGTADHKVSLAKILLFEKSRVYYYRKLTGRLGSWYCRFLLSFFYFSRSFGSGKAYFRQAAIQMWYV
ncbi:MAG: glycosyltransferase family 2 protein [Sphingobacteriaceae bacterium]|nr:glycosyltransferase family 2 protein [Sphingobacteriaceae bacterium]